MIRRFLPVGQGAFYVEQFALNDKTLNVIYDCGSITKGISINDKIDSVFKEGEEIEIVFISHVDRDHINGLEHLINHCIVKNIVFPYIKKTNKWLLYLDCLCNDDNPSENDFIFRFINNPFEAFNNSRYPTRLYQVAEKNEEQNIRLYNDIPVIESGDNVIKIIYGEEEAEKIKWEYVPFNFRCDKRAEIFKEKLKSNFAEAGIKFHEDEAIIEKWIDINVRTAIINAYKQIKGSLNTNSMVLFSGIRDKTIVQEKADFICPCYYYCFGDDNCCLKLNGCLYTWDYEAKGSLKWNNLKNAYIDYWEYIGCVQIPHHGSSYNYNIEFEQMKAYYVISAGRNNKYGHPHKSVIESLLISKNHPFIVTEQPESELVLHIASM